MRDLKSYIREVPDFPTRGVSFKDIGPLLRSSVHFQDAIDEMAAEIALYEPFSSTIVAIESRGFVFGAALAFNLGAGLVLARKKGKLPGDTVSMNYSLEYADAVLELQKDALEAGEQVLIVDDVLATGGTALAAAELVRRAKGTVQGFVFLAELSYLGGRERLRGEKVFSLLSFDE